MEAKEFFNTLSNRLAEVKLGKVGEILTNLKATSPVLTLLPKLAVMKPARRSEHPACFSLARPVVKTLADTLGKKTCQDTSEGEAERETLLKTLANTVAEI